MCIHVYVCAHETYISFVWKERERERKRERKRESVCDMGERERERDLLKKPMYMEKRICKRDV